MAEMTSEERVMTALRREVPDRVPHFEWLVDRKVREALCPGCKSHNEFAVQMEHDAVLTGPHFGKEWLDERRWLSEWGFVMQETAEEHGVEVEPAIRTMEDLEQYKPPDPRIPERYYEIEELVYRFRGDMAVIAHLNDVFSIPRYLLGMEKLLLSIVREPELVRGVVDISVDVNLAMAEELVSRGVKIVYTGDDYAYNEGPLMSPRHFRELFYPGLRRVMGGFKELGLIVIKHTDGNLWSILDMIVDSGIDCLDPIDPLAGMDLAEVKAKYGDRLALKGNVDCAETMTFGTVEDVIEETKEALRKGAPGGGYILSSSNSIHSSVKPENYKAMMDTLREYGRYPITL